MERYTGYYVNKDKSELYEIIDLEKVASDRNLPWVQNFSKKDEDGEN